MENQRLVGAKFDLSFTVGRRHVTPELDRLLCSRYPRIFAERNLSPRETCMCWGFPGDGWYALIDTLCAQLQLRTERHGEPQIVVTQVKEKLGRLRVYVQEASPAQHKAIAAAERMSARICEVCGEPGQFVRDGFYRTRCARHRDVSRADAKSPSAGRA